MVVHAVERGYDCLCDDQRWALITCLVLVVVYPGTIFCEMSSLVQTETNIPATCTSVNFKY